VFCFYVLFFHLLFGVLSMLYLVGTVPLSPRFFVPFGFGLLVLGPSDLCPTPL